MADTRHLVINLVWVEEGEITVGATDSERWKWEREDGASGADAKTLLWATLRREGDRLLAIERVEYFCHSEDSLRELVLSGTEYMLDMARLIHEHKLDQRQARAELFGRAFLNQTSDRDE